MGTRTLVGDEGSAEGDRSRPRRSILLVRREPPPSLTFLSTLPSLAGGGRLERRSRLRAAGHTGEDGNGSQTSSGKKEKRKKKGSFEGELNGGICLLLFGPTRECNACNGVGESWADEGDLRRKEFVKVDGVIGESGLEWLAMINESTGAPASRFANCGNLFSPLDFLLGTRGLPPSPGGFCVPPRAREERLDR